jgi:phosphatidylserine/phosphatidylglycerophosphate/cardiolipin synthase-like enzyme
MRLRPIALGVAVIALTTVTLQSVAQQERTGAEIAFSPEAAAAQALVVKTINRAERTIDLAAYAFTSPAIIEALVEARRRNVNIRVLVDKSNVGDKKSAGKSALNTLVAAGVYARTVSIYPQHHDKYIVADDKHLQTGSFDYSKGAAESNSENVLVLWNTPVVAKQYTTHFNNRWSRGVDHRQL